jgi:acyl-CoA thioester hydrolase
MAPFVHRMRVRYHETDPQQHVYNARYLEYIDVAMVEFVRSLGWDYSEGLGLGFDPVLVHVEMDFIAPASLDEILAVEVAPTEIGKTSFRLGFEISRAGGGRVLNAEIVYVNFDAVARAKRPIPANIRERLNASQRTPG